MRTNHPYMQRLNWIIPVLVLSVLPIPAQALCTFIPGNGRQVHAISMPKLFVPRDAAVGSTIPGSRQTVPAVRGTNGSDGRFATCQSPGEVFYYVRGGNSINAGSATHVYPSGIPGIGLRFFMITGAYQQTYYRFVDVGSGSAGSYIGEWGWYLGGNGYWGVEAIVTGQVASGNYTKSTSLVATVMLDALLVTEISVLPFEVVTQTCTVSSVPVKLGWHFTGEFGGVGSTVGTRNFSIELSNCPSTLVEIDYTLNPLNPIISIADGVIAVDAGANAASGVGIQLQYDDGQPVRFNESKAAVFDRAAGTGSVPLKAALYQTENTINPGKANASVEFTLTYR